MGLRILQSQCLAGNTTISYSRIYELGRNENELEKGTDHKLKLDQTISKH